jgi:MFS family permease
VSQDPGYRAAVGQLRDGNFARLFSARFVSTFGSAMAPIAMAFAVLDLTGSPRLVGYVIASQSVAQIAVQLFGGALADRWSRRRLIVFADLLAASSQATMAFLLLSGTAEVWQLSVLMALNGVGFALHWPAAVGLVPQVVEREKLQPANALLSLAQSGAFGLGGACAGVLVALVGAGVAIAVDAATFGVSAVLMVGMRPRPQVRARGSSLLAELRDGWREFVSHRWLWVIVAQFSLVVAAWNGGFMVVGPVVAARTLGGPVAWGWVAGAFGAGLLTGGVLGMWLPVRHPMLVASVCVFTFALPLVLLTGPAPVPAIAAGAFVAGVGGELFGVLWNTALHTHVAPEALSRVSAYDILGSIALAPVGEAIAGPLVEGIGSRATLWLAAACITVPTVAVLFVRDVRALRSSRPEDRAGPLPGT